MAEVEEVIPIRKLCGEPYNVCAHTFCSSPSHFKITYSDAWQEHFYTASALKKCENCGGCWACCSCWTCKNCAQKYTHVIAKACSACALCPDCCTCLKCAAPGCKIRVRQPDKLKQFCQHGLCRVHQINCCRIVIEFLDQPEINFWTAKLNEHRHNPTTRFLAAEIEVASVAKSNRPVIALMQELKGGVVEDGSLPKGGFEITTAPANGDVWIDHIQRIQQVLDGLGASVNERCGLHVHVDARDYSIYDLRRLILLYEKLEPALFSMVPPDRVTHHNMAGLPYSGPCGYRFANPLRQLKSAKDTRRTLLESIYGVKLTKLEADMEAMAANERDFVEKMEQAYRARGYSGKRLETMMEKLKLTQRENFDKVKGLNKLKQTKRVDARYAAVNFHSYFLHGTIEVRMHHGTTRADDITKWGMLWAEIMAWAMTHTEAEITAFPKTHMCNIRSCPHAFGDPNALPTSQKILKEITPDYLKDFVDKRFAIFGSLNLGGIKF